jgi:dynein heavy chain, axonemal
LSIRNALCEKRYNFFFEEITIKLVLSCRCNITLNPNYEGRWELPYNLKALFRPCAIMVADYKMIAENFLYSLGFTNSRLLAKKIVISLNLARYIINQLYLLYLYKKKLY